MQIVEVDALDAKIQREILAFNLLDASFPPLEARHLHHGQWWFAYADDGPEPIAFAGLVPLTPFEHVAYFKRAFVFPMFRGRGIQRALMQARQDRAVALGYTHLVSDCAADNKYSAANFAAFGFTRCDPEQHWAAVTSLYWIKDIRLT